MYDHVLRGTIIFYALIITDVDDIFSRSMYANVLRVNIIFCTVISIDVDDIFSRSMYAMYYVEPLCPIVGERYHFELSSMST
jgi:hypothetical protein